jgi:hypothetical protein
MGFFDFLFKKKRIRPEIKLSIRSVKPPQEWQLERARKLGINVIAGMTFEELDEKLTKAEFDKPTTHQQIKKAKAFGMIVTPNMTYGQLASRLNEAALNQPAKQEQIELCKRVGIPLPPGTTCGDADKLIENARQNLKYAAQFRKIDDEFQRELEAEEDSELREQYGDKLLNEFRQWEKLSVESGTQYLMVFRRGKEIAVEVVEFEDGPEIIEGKSPYIKLSLLLPKKERHDRDYFSLEWEKEMEIRSSNVLHIQKLDRTFSDCTVVFEQESPDYEAYRKVIEKAKEFSKRFELP